ncbi:AbiTii domain-containing protein [Actinomadura roseirufa]|uniref:AbiTii domain-containing protein n=1 Tax=Actinomadura roseirufa TaxID=2094049 RepID=UPI001040F345|nr:hypothetical protein [Actinomadura roseirufa]
MSILQEIISSASGDQLPTAVLLRKVKVLAARARIQPLEAWVEHELNGYPQGENVPSYRGPFDAEVRGNFVGPFNSSTNNAPIPPSSLPKELRDGALFKVEFRQGLPELEDLVARSRNSEDPLRVPWPSDAVPYVNQLIEDGKARMYPMMGLVQAWKPVSPSQVRGILDTVRNRVLDLALSIETEDPDAGERAGSSLSEERGNQIFNTAIYGGSPNVAVGSSHFVQQTLSNPARSDEELISQLRQVGLPAELLEELEASLNEDRTEANGELVEPGPKVNGWLGKIATIGARTGGRIGGSVTTSVVTQMVLAYFGLTG